ncbi:MAG: DUF3426 domain-containing protein [Candidatus Thiodiazotropha sp.]
MFTQCPHCMTLFRITTEQLKAAEGRVRCCQCNQVFNALQRLQEYPKAFNNQATTSQFAEFLHPDQDAELLESFDSQLERPDSTLINDSEVERSLDDLADDSALTDLPLVEESGLVDDSTPVESPALSEDSNLEDDQRSLAGDSQSQLLYEQDDGLETEPDYFAAGTESQMSELLDQDSASLLLPDDDLPQSSLAEIIELDIPQPELKRAAETREDESETQQSNDVEADADNAPEQAIPPAVETQAHTSDTDDAHPDKDLFDDLDHPFEFEPSDEELRRRRNNRLWLFGSLLLILPLAGQIAWQMRDRLIYYDNGRLLLNTLCDVAGCSVPMRRAMDKIVIVQRALTAHPDKPGVLLMQLEIVNTAAFAQPYPKLQLSLFNEMEKLIARRTFTPEEYLDLPTQRLPMLNKQTATHIALELVDPGSEVTGFKFDFL